MGFKCGIIGLPNVGKSTLFNALTRSNTEASNFPFCTIKPQIGIVPMPDIRLEQLTKIVQPQRVIPTTMEFVDIAGLVKGASKGAGLGNQFLANIRETEAIGHVVRCFEDRKIIHVNGTINPERDIDIINTEMALSDLDTCKRAIQRVQKKNKDNYKKIKTEVSILEKCLLHLEQAKMLRTLRLNSDEKTVINYLNFLTLKPTMYIANVNENSFINNSFINQVINIAQVDNSIVVPVCASIESDISKLKDEEFKDEKFNEFIIELGLEESSLKRVIRAGYALLNLQTYFTVGVKEVRAWTIPIGINALKAASKIHTDFEKGFIRAQVIAFKDFMEYKGERGAKEAGKIRLEGKNYIVKDGDIINFLFNV